MAGERALVGGRYRLAEPLGRGGMATVRRGVDTRLGRPVAIKQLVPSLAADPECQARFQREARSAASLSHPAIVAVFDTGEESDPDTAVSVPYLVMELVEGQTLRDVLRSGNKMLPERALELTRDVLTALSHSHEAGIVHRDIKPANVMVTATGGVKVMDFGIARTVTDTSSDFTRTASVIGTAHYLSPEQARGERVGFSSDLYSAGCLLYELLTGRPPFVGETVLSVVYQHVRENPVSPSQLDPAIAADVDAIVLKALAKDPADRYATAREMKADIDRVLAGDDPVAWSLPVRTSQAEPNERHEPGAAAGGTTGARAADSTRAGRRGLALGTAMIMMLLALGGYGFYRSNQPPLAVADQLVNVPELVGRSQAGAEQALHAVRLSARVRHIAGARDETVGTVVTQSPASGRDAPPGSVVTVEVNDGPRRAEIPTGLRGRKAPTVRTKLEALGFTNISETTEPRSTGSREGTVLSVEPEQGNTVALNREITLTVAGPVAPPARSRPTDARSSAPQDESKADGPDRDEAEAKDHDKDEAEAKDQDKDEVAARDSGTDSADQNDSARDEDKPQQPSASVGDEPTKQPTPRASPSPSVSASPSRPPNRSPSPAAPSPSVTPTPTPTPTATPQPDTRRVTVRETKRRSDKTKPVKAKKTKPAKG